MKYKLKNPDDLYEVDQFNYFNPPNGVLERKRSWLDNLTKKAINLDFNWYIEINGEKVWLTQGDYIVTDMFGHKRVFKPRQFEAKFELAFSIVKQAEQIRESLKKSQQLIRELNA